MEHISGIIQHIIGSLICPSCEGNDQENGPVPDETDRKRWIDTEGTLVECPMCENGEIYWEENWLAGGYPMWEGHHGVCEHCEGSGELTIRDRCDTCGRLEHSKGPKKIPEEDSIFGHLEYPDIR